MSVELYSTRGSAENEASPQIATVGGNKPLHRFIRGQPKTVGIIVVILGTSFVTVSMAIPGENDYASTIIPPGVLLGSLLILSGIMYILAEHNPTKKIVTISLALSVVTLLMSCWNVLHLVMNIEFGPHYKDYDYSEDNSTNFDPEDIGYATDAIFTFYTAVSFVTLTVMASLAGAALRSTKNQASIMMTAAPSETPVE